MAVRGRRTDGHRYIPDVIENGASGIVVEKGFDLDSVTFDNSRLNFYVVEDTLKFLGDFANSYLKKIGSDVIGITGTNGKTTVKDFTRKILSAKFRTDGTKGNLNNLYGLPLSVFSMDSGTEVAVLEMGMSELGEISRLCEIAEPKIKKVKEIVGFVAG